jgi:hypothetical protein
MSTRGSVVTVLIAAALALPGLAACGPEVDNPNPSPTGQLPDDLCRDPMSSAYAQCPGYQPPVFPSWGSGG